MEARVTQLLEAHAQDRDLTAEKDLAGLDWSQADLTGFNLSHCVLSSPGQTGTFTETKLNEANLFRVHLENATLDKAKLHKADLRGANLEGAYLEEADLSSALLENAKLDGAYMAKANLKGADLSHASYVGGDLIGANLNNANLAGITMEAIDASRSNFGSAILRSGRIAHCHFEKAHLNHVDLADTEMESCYFSQSHLQNSNMARAQYQECQFTECHMNDTNLAGADTRNCKYDRSHMKGSIMVKGHFDYSTFIDTSLQGSFQNKACFKDCDLEGADLRNTKVRGADFTRAKLYQTVLSGSNMEFAKLDEIWTYQAGCKDTGDSPESESPGSATKDETSSSGADYHRSMDIFRNLKNTFRDNGAHSRASRYSYLESVMQRHQYKQEERWGMWVLFLLADMASGYGEHVHKTILFAIGLTFVFAMVYDIGDGVTHHAADGEKDAEDVTFNEHLFFSVTTFTTLGYGDYSPNSGLFQMVAVTEAMIGVILMAFIVVTLSRKIVT